MTRRRRDPRIEPRDIPARLACQRLGLSEEEFRSKIDELLIRGFPHPDVTTGMFDLKAIDEWMDQRVPSSRRMHLDSLVAERLERMGREADRKKQAKLYAKQKQAKLDAKQEKLAGPNG